VTKRKLTALEDKLVHQLDEPFRSRALAAAYRLNDRLQDDPTCYMIIRDAYRDPESQLKLWAKGRHHDGEKWLEKHDPLDPIVTKAPPGRSAHEYRRAIHLILIDSVTRAWLKDDNKRWHLVGEEAERQNLTWGGSWPTLRDYAHIESKDWRTVAQLFGWAGMTGFDRFDYTTGGRIRLKSSDIT
jgi:hypothetical protein